MKLLLIFFISSNMAFAASNLFCLNPKQYTCTENSDLINLREEKIKNIELNIKNNAFQEMLELDGDLLAGIELRDYEEIQYLSPRRLRKRVQKIYYNHLRSHFANYLKANKLPNDLGFQSLKETFIKLIESDSAIEKDLKFKIIAILNQTRLVSLQSQIEEASMEDVLAVYKNCNNQTFEDNAFATELKGQKVIIICPGYIIGSIEFIKSRNLDLKYAFYPMIMTIGHELGHHFDYEMFPDLYKVIFNDTAIESDQFKSKVEDYMSEITADIWGLKLLSQYTKAISNTSLYADILAGNMNDLCDTPDDNVHPSGDYRIEKISKKYLCEK